MNGSAFSSPIIATIHGKRQLITQTRTKLAGIDLDSGEVLWDYTVKALERHGYATTGYLHSSDALERFRNDPDAFDLVLTDQAMPGISGLHLAEHLHAIRSELPVVLCTGYSEALTERGITSSGIHSVLRKPVTIQELALAVRDALDAHA